VILRDAQVLPALRAILEGGLLRYLDQARQILTEPLGARGRRHQPVDAAARAAIDLHTWRALAPLGDAEAAELIELAADS
jgi:hypothetical protein